MQTSPSCQYAQLLNPLMHYLDGYEQDRLDHSLRERTIEWCRKFVNLLPVPLLNPWMACVRHTRDIVITLDSGKERLLMVFQDDVHDVEVVYQRQGDTSIEWKTSDPSDERFSGILPNFLDLNGDAA